MFCAGMSAQDSTSRLAGTLVDPQGKGIASALVTVKNESTGVVRTIYADNNGIYSVGGLSAGRYTVHAAAAGFAEVSRSIDVIAGQDQQLALTLAISSVAEQVEVNAGIDSIAAQ